MPPPATKPLVAVLGMDRGRVLVHLTDETTPDGRAKPDGTVGAEVYSFVAAPNTTPPADLEEWRYEGLATRRQFEVDYNQTDGGKVATIVARWLNGKGQPARRATR